MKNHNYTTEITMANQFVIEHNRDSELMNFLQKMREGDYKHSDRWSIIFDWLANHYPAATGSLVTGLTYWCEN